MHISKADNIKKNIISNIPRKNNDFVGRVQQLNSIETVLNKDINSVIAVVGGSGIGKTQIAKQYANDNIENYELIWWIDAAKNISAQFIDLGEGLNDSGLLKLHIYIDKHNEGKSVINIKKALDNACIEYMIVFDNVSHMTEIESFLPISGKECNNKSHVVITSKNSLLYNNMVKIEKFDRQESIALLNKLTGSTDNKTLNLLAALLCDYPLAIAQAGSYLKLNPNVTPSQYMVIYNNELGRLWEYEAMAVKDNHVLLDHYHATIAATIEINIKELRKKSEKAFELIAFSSFLYHKNIPEELLLKYFKMNILEMNHAISLLQNYSLFEFEIRNINREKINLYSMHEIYQTVIMRLLTRSEIRKYSESAAQILNNLIPTQLDISLPMLLNNAYLMSHLDSICDHANLANIINDDIISLYVRKLEYFLSEKRDYPTSLILIDKIDSLLDAKQDAASTLTKIRFKLMKAAYFTWCTANYDKSIAEAIDVLEYLKQYPEAQEEYLMVYNRFAQTNVLMGDLDEALKYSDLGMDVVKNSKGFLGNQDAFYGIRARILEDQGNLEQALISINDGLNYINKNKFFANEIIHNVSIPLLDAKASLFGKLGKYREAYEIAKSSFEDARSSCTLPAARQLVVMANSMLNFKNIEAAKEYINQAMDIFKKLYSVKGANRYYAYAYLVLGDIKVAEDKYHEAQESYTTSEEMYNKILKSKKIDEISILYSKLAINGVLIHEPAVTHHYLELHKDTFGKIHHRNFEIINYLTKKNLLVP